jgi:hypothetical protein
MHTALPAGFTYHGVHYEGDEAEVAQGDHFLSVIVPLIETSEAFRQGGVVVIWTDETEGDRQEQLWALPDRDRDLTAGAGQRLSGQIRPHPFLRPGHDAENIRAAGQHLERLPERRRQPLERQPDGGHGGVLPAGGNPGRAAAGRQPLAPLSPSSVTPKGVMAPGVTSVRSRKPQMGSWQTGLASGGPTGKRRAMSPALDPRPRGRRRGPRGRRPPLPPPPDDTDALLQVGQQLFDDYAPPEVKDQYSFPTREDLDRFAAQVQRALDGDSLEHLAALEPQARAALAAAQAIPGTDDYTGWLALRLDEIDAARQVLRPPAAGHPLPPSVSPHPPLRPLAAARAGPARAGRGRRAHAPAPRRLRRRGGAPRPRLGGRGGVEPEPRGPQSRRGPGGSSS